MWQDMTPIKKLLLLHVLTRKRKKPESEKTDSLGKNRGNCGNVDWEEEKGT